jgi:predicted deacylase
MKKLFILIVLAMVALPGLAETQAQAPRVFKDIPPEYLVQADVIPDFWVSTVDGAFAFLDQKVHKGIVQPIGTTAGGRPMRAVFYGQPRGPKGTTTFSGSIGFHDVRAFLGPDSDKKVYMAMGSVHGGEIEGIVGIVNLISVLETGSDLRGKPWPGITAAAAKLDRIILLPITNVDGRARVPYRMLRNWGQNVDVAEYFNTGGQRNGKLVGYPTCKQFIPLDFSTVGFPGGYPNDAGVNFQHDDFFGHPQPETRALLDLTARERPDLTLNMHTGGKFMSASREFIEPSLTPANEEFYRRVQTALTLAGLEATDDVARESDPSHAQPGVFNLDTVINLNSGALAMLIESPSHASAPAVRDGKPRPFSADDILDAQLTAHQAAMTFLVETGGRARWSKK